MGRNDPCPCGSGKKHKRCCPETDPPGNPRRLKSSRNSEAGSTPETCR
ncbi:MAG: SEC-C metal-binding domain-containing protein [Steroidobacteraceae bacterium]